MSPNTEENTSLASQYSHISYRTYQLPIESDKISYLLSSEPISLDSPKATPSNNSYNWLNKNDLKFASNDLLQRLS